MLSDAMQANGHMPRVHLEILVGREEGQAQAVRHRTDEEVDGSSGDAATLAALTALDELTQIRRAIEKRQGTLPGSLLDSLREERDGELTTGGEISR